jgi:membrane protease YdiL (CAAX protease family)
METIKPESVELSSISNLIIVGIIAVTIWKVIADVVAVTVGKPKLNEAMNKFQNMPLIALLFVLAITVIAEEVVFRGLFLWAMPKVFQGDTALYILVILSSFLFATLHIFNYKKAGGYLYLTKIIPFFVEALLLAFVFLKFGLFGAFLVHYVHNFVSTFNSRIHFEKTSGLTV